MPRAFTATLCTALFTLLAPSDFASAGILSGVPSLSNPIVNPANGHTYTLLAASSWTEAQAEAESWGSNLATVNDQAENDWIVNTFGNFNNIDRNLWIGLSDATSEGTFTWADGSPVGFTHWAAGDPNGLPGASNIEEDFVFMWKANVQNLPGSRLVGTWNDTNNMADLPAGDADLITGVFGVVETVPEPTSVALVACGGLMLIRRRR